MNRMKVASHDDADGRGQGSYLCSATMKTKTLLTAVIGLALASLPAFAADLKVGAKAPDFELTGSDGKNYKLSDMKGKAVVIAWFPKAFTGGCTKECESFRESGREIQKFNAAYFTASCDTVEVNTKFAKSLNLDYPILCDPDKKVAEAYGTVVDGKGLSKRWTFYIDAEGMIAFIDKEVKTGSHGADVVARLEALKVAKK